MIRVTRALTIKEQEERRMIARLKEAEKALLDKANIALGCWGTPKGALPTFSRAEWFSAAQKHDVLDRELEIWLKRWWSGIWLRDLSD